MSDTQDTAQEPSAGARSTASRPGVVWSVAVAGGLVAASPFALTLWVDSSFGASQVIAATTFTNIGTTLLLAALLFYLEPKFTRTVTQAVTETTRTEVAAQTEDIRHATTALQQQVADINRELEERRQARAERRTSVIQDLRDGYSFDTVASALEQANEIKGLWHGAVTVPAGPSFSSPRIRIFWGEERLGGRFSTGNIFDDGPPAIVVSYEVPHDEQASGYKSASARWRHGQTAGEALDELITGMQTAGHTSAAAGVGSEVFSNLADALEQALSARAGEDDGWITGPLDEWITDGWAVTESGLESRDGGLRIAAADFPDARFGAASAARKEPPKKFDPVVPGDVDPNLWACAVERSRYKFKGSQSASIAAQGLGPKAYTSKWNPRRYDWPLAERL